MTVVCSNSSETLVGKKYSNKIIWQETNLLIKFKLAVWVHEKIIMIRLYFKPEAALPFETIECTLYLTIGARVTVS